MDDFQIKLEKIIKFWNNDVIYYWHLLCKILFFDIIVTIILALFIIFIRSNETINNWKDLAYVIFYEADFRGKVTKKYYNRTEDTPKPSSSPNIENKIKNYNTHIYLYQIMLKKDNLITSIFSIPVINKLMFAIVIFLFYYWRLGKLIKYDSDFIDEMMYYFISKVKIKYKQYKTSILELNIILQSHTQSAMSPEEVIEMVCLYLNRDYFCHKSIKFYKKYNYNNVIENLISLNNENNKIKQEDKELLKELIDFLKLQFLFVVDFDYFDSILRFIVGSFIIVFVIIVIGVISYYSIKIFCPLLITFLR